MAAKRPARQASNYCPTCGQRIPMPLTEVSKLARRYLSKKGWTQANLARVGPCLSHYDGYLYAGQAG